MDDVTGPLTFNSDARAESYKVSGTNTTSASSGMMAILGKQRDAKAGKQTKHKKQETRERKRLLPHEGLDLANHHHDGFQIMVKGSTL